MKPTKLNQMDELKLQLSQYGQVEVINEGAVFLIFMTGNDLTEYKKVSKVINLVVDYTKEEYPKVQAMRNEKNYLIMVLTK